MHSCARRHWTRSHLSIPSRERWQVLPQHRTTRFITKSSVPSVRALPTQGSLFWWRSPAGRDSVALLDSAVWPRPETVSQSVVHCNHGLRGAESDEDASFVAAPCRRLHVPLLREIAHIGVREAGVSSSLQARARDLRYRLFPRSGGRATVRSGGAWARGGRPGGNDSVTHVARGRFTGLAGMPHIRERALSDLFCVTRTEILAYPRRWGCLIGRIPAMRPRGILRNRVRHEVVPILESLAPAATPVARTSGRCVASR